MPERCSHCGLPVSKWPTPTQCVCGCPYSTTAPVDQEVAEAELCADCALGPMCAAHRANMDA